MIKHISSTFLLVVVINYLSAQNITTLRIDPDNARGGTASQIFDSLQFIPLETTKESLFGSIDQLEVTDSLFFILDIRSRSVLIFRRDGSLHARIISDGPNKYFGYFALDRKANRIIIDNNYANGLLVYDFNGKFLQKHTAPKNIGTFYLFEENKIIYNIRRPFNPKKLPQIPYDLCYSVGFNSISKYCNPYNPKCEDGEYNIDRNPMNFSGEEHSCMFSLPFEYKAYQLNDTGIIHQYNFIFPLQYSLPPKFSSDSSFQGSRAKYIYTDQENYKKINSISSVFKVGDYLLFCAANNHLSLTAERNYLYNLTNDNLLSFARVTGDSASLYFPILSSLLERVDAVYKNRIYTSLASFRIFSTKNNLNKQISYPPRIKEYLSTGSKNNNPVIIIARLKENL